MKTAAIIAAAMLALLGIQSASAASQVTLTWQPTAPVAGDYITFTGCGWTPTNMNKSGNTNQNDVLVTLYVPGGIQEMGVPVAKNGCFTSPPGSFQATVSGSYMVTAFQGGGGKAHQTSAIFTVG